MEDRHIGSMMGRIGHLVRERLDARLGRCGVTPSQARVLLFLCGREGPVPQGALVDFLQVKPSTANGILDRMEAKGLLTREISREDARRRLVAVTEKGREHRERMRTAVEDTEAVLVRGLPAEDREVLLSYLGRMISNLEEDRQA